MVSVSLKKINGLILLSKFNRYFLNIVLTVIIFFKYLKKSVEYQ